LDKSLISNLYVRSKVVFWRAVFFQPIRDSYFKSSLVGKKLALQKGHLFFGLEIRYKGRIIKANLNWSRT